jgi:hypothetical protein
MKNLTDLQKRIMVEFIELQMPEGWELDECAGLRYKTLSSELKVSRDRLRPEMIELRNYGFIELLPTVDWENYAPSGSGYFLTTEGREYARQHFFEPAKDPTDKWEALKLKPLL